MAKKELEGALEKEMGKSIEEIRNAPVDKMRAEVESSLGRVLSYKSYYPLIGRGNILRDRIVTHDIVEERLGRAMHDKKKA
ncbi:MAG: hypothetical protein R6V10_05455 [bacterium]